MEMRKSILTKQTKKLKDARKISNRIHELDWGRDLYDWIPVEKPQFIGWETTINLSERSLRRPDADKLLAVMNIIKLNKPVFTKDTFIIKLIRSSNKNYLTIHSKYNEYVRTKHKHPYYSETIPGIENYNSCSLSVNDWEQLDTNLKKYFYKHEKHYPGNVWRDSHVIVRYKLSSSNFPIRDLVVKINKAYSTHKGIPRADDISESTKLRDELFSGKYRSYYSAKNGFRSNGPGKWYKHVTIISNRRRWKELLDEVPKRAIHRPKLVESILDKKARHTINKITKNQYW